MGVLIMYGCLNSGCVWILYWCFIFCMGAYLDCRCVSRLCMVVFVDSVCA